MEQQSTSHTDTGTYIPNAPKPIFTAGATPQEQVPKAAFSYSTSQESAPYLSVYPAAPLFAMEQVVAESKVPVMTLRAWERHYGVPAPERNSMNQLLYSRRDIVVARWIRQRIIAGKGVRQVIAELAQMEPRYFTSRGVDPQSIALPIRQSLEDLQEALMRALALSSDVDANTVLSDAFAAYPVGVVCQQLLYPVLQQILTLCKNGRLPHSVEALAANATRAQTQHLIEAGLAPKDALSYLSGLVTRALTGTDTPAQIGHDATTDPSQLEQPLLDAMYAMDSTAAQRILDEAFRHFSVEDVCLNLLQGILFHIGTLWAEKRLSVAVEHFATHIIRTRVAHIFDTTPNQQQGAMIFISCAPQEPHEIGALMLALFWRRIGLNIVYLGQMVEIPGLLQEVMQRRPWVVCVSAMTRPRVKDVARFARKIAKLASPRPIFCFGGGAFGRDTKLINSVKGIYLGTNAQEATKRIQELAGMHTIL